jgi:hypothetical protein
LHLGQTYDQYRPNGPSNPTGAANWYGTMVAAFDDSANFKFAKPALYGDPISYALVDGSLVSPGDYFIGSGNTMFIAVIPSILPIVAIKCNSVINILRPASNTGVGAQPYGGDQVGSEIPIMTQWPCLIDIGTKGEVGATALPGDVRMSWYRILLPATHGVTIEAFDVVNDNVGRRYKTSAVERTQLGWRLTVMLAET